MSGVTKPNIAYLWTEQLRKNGNGNAYGDEANVLRALRTAPELVGIARWNSFANSIEIAREVPWREVTIGEPWTDGDDLDVTVWLQESGAPVRSRNVVADSVARVAKDNSYHPVIDYLGSLTWDGKPRLKTWLSDYLGADADPDYLAAVGAKFLISAVARVYEPGCPTDHVLVLEGRQGVGESRTLQTIGNPWTTDSLADLHSKDAAIQVQGVWLVELAELAAMRKSDIEATKAFISRRVDRFRPPYGRRPIDVSRQCVFIATTNETAYLRDPTGNRRFWPVRITHADIDLLALDRDKLWAEATFLQHEGHAWHLAGPDVTLASTEQELRMYRTEVEQQILTYLDDREAQGVEAVTTRDIYERVFNLNFPDDTTQAGKLGPAINQSLFAHGWIRDRETGHGDRRRVWYVKDSVLTS